MDLCAHNVGSQRSEAELSHSSSWKRPALVLPEGKLVWSSVEPSGADAVAELVFKSSGHRAREQAVLHKQYSSPNGEITLKFSSLQPYLVSGKMSYLNLEGTVRSHITFITHIEHLPENTISTGSNPSE